MLTREQAIELNRLHGRCCETLGAWHQKKPNAERERYVAERAWVKYLAEVTEKSDVEPAV